ncbi:MAG: erythromycin esterase family protein [Myxococcales bacterium]|nr:erythromycin esterase family protein [Myxococcales bacterium]
MRPPGWMMVLAAVGCGGATRAPTPVEAPPAPASPTAVAPARSPVPALGAELNLGFEELDGDLPRGWTPRAAGPGGAADATPRGGADTVAHSGDHSLRVIGTGDGAAMAGASLDATALRGKRVRLHGWVRTDGVGPPGWAGLWLRVDGGAGGLDNMSDRGLVGTSDWREAIASLEVPAGAERLVFGPLLVGAGTAWFDDLALEVVEVVEAAPPHPIEVGGVVVDGHGAVVPGAQVAVIQANQLVALVAGDRAGRFHATVTSGTLSVSALAPGRVGGFIEEARYDGDRRDLRVILPDGGGVEVRGRLVASAPVPAGEPVLVWPVSEHSGDMFALPAAADGTFAAVLPRGDQYGALVLGERVQGTGSAARVGDAVTLEVPVTVLAPAPPEVAAWLGRAGAPLTTVEAGHGFADLAPIGRMVGTARVVGLGEATHGSREFFQLKHRLLEYLVAEHGFTVFAIEANQPECRAINAYVLHGTGDARAALAGIYFWTWDTEEVLAMIEWMRAWNADPAHRRKVQFVGFDMQVPRVAEAAVAAFVRQVAPAEADALLAPLGDPARGRPGSRR